MPTRSGAALKEGDATTTSTRTVRRPYDIVEEHQPTTPAAEPVQRALPWRWDGATEARASRYLLDYVEGRERVLGGEFPRYPAR